MKWLALGLALAFFPNYHAGAIAPRWALLGFAVPLLLLWRKWPILKTEHTLAAAFFAVALVGVDWRRPDQLNALWELSLFGGVFILAQTSEDDVWTWMGWGVAVSSVFVVAYWMGQQLWVEASPPSGLFTNRNVLAETAAILLVCSLLRQQWVLTLGLLPSALLSREAWVAIAVTVVFWAWRHSKMTFIILTFAALVALPEVLSLRPNTGRIGILESTWAVTNLHGYGLGTYYTLFPAFDFHGEPFLLRTDHVHNEFLELLFELGIWGLGLFLALVSLAWTFGRGVERYVLLVVLVECGMGFPLHLPTTAFMAAWALGRLCLAIPSPWGLMAMCRVGFERGLDAGKTRFGGNRRGDISV